MNGGVGRESRVSGVGDGTSPWEPFSHVYEPREFTVPPPPPPHTPQDSGACFGRLTGDGPAMVQVREWTCQKPQGKWHLQKQYPGILTPLLGVVLLSQKPENLP